MAYRLPPGLLRLGRVTSSYNYTTNNIGLEVGISSFSPVGNKKFYFTYADNAGVLIGAVPPPDNPVLVAPGEADHYPLVYYTSNTQNLPRNLQPGQLLLRSNQNNNIILRKNDIIIGQDFFNLSLNNNFGSTNNNFSSHFSFPQSSRKIDAPIRREYLSKDSLYSGSRSLEDLPIISLYDDELFFNSTRQISLIPEDYFSIFNSKTDLPPKNPSFSENRQIIYEFDYASNMLDLQNEAKKYDLNTSQVIQLPANDRRKHRSDTFSLSLSAPNYLIESIKGTSVDIYGNLLDLNRQPIFYNLNDNQTPTEIYYSIRESQRKVIAFHFEINARKDLGSQNNIPDVKDFSDYARKRSRFFVDVDKEGQFKINVPASSESGNIPLLTRYENYNAIVAADDPSKNPNELLPPNESSTDLFHESFSGIKNSIAIKNKSGAETSPLDRKYSNQSHIKHGTVYHDITATCFAHRSSSGFANYLRNKPPSWDEIFPAKILDKIVKDTISIGENAGGRSGSINLDGSVELNVGANTVDRQSIWLDTAGGMVANIGKDKNNVSAAVNMDGQLLLQVGGRNGVSQDSRFSKLNNAFTSGAIDIRVLVDGYAPAIIRVDKAGISLISNSKIYLESNGGIDIRSGSNVTIEGETVTINERVIHKQVTSTVASVGG